MTEETLSGWAPYSFLIEDELGGDWTGDKRLVVFWETAPGEGKMVDDIIQHTSVGFKPFCRKILSEKTGLSNEEFDELWKAAVAALKESKRPYVEPVFETSEAVSWVVQYNDSNYPGWKDSRANDIDSHDAAKVHLKAYKKTYKKVHGDRFTFRIVKRHMKITDEVLP